MTGGFAYVYDEDRSFVDRYNSELVEIAHITSESTESHRWLLRKLLSEHVEATGSEWAREIDTNFADHAWKFWLVKPKAASLSGLIAQAVANPQ
jgi:glutamate synthase (NADPH/NADH) large chain